MPLYTGSCCLICYKECSNNENQNSATASVQTLSKNAEICKRFCVLASRYCELDPFHYSPFKTIISKRSYNPEKACENCVEFLKSFCDIYQQWENLEMRLRWRAHEIAKIMDLADTHNRSILEEKLTKLEMTEQIEEIDDFRTDFKDTSIKYTFNLF